MKVFYPKLVHNYDRYEKCCAVLIECTRCALLDSCSESNYNEYIEEVGMYIMSFGMLMN